MVGSHLVDYILEKTDWNIYGLLRWSSKLDNIEHHLQAINKKKRLFHHFNLEWTGHKKGRLYLIVRILKKGSFDGKFYKPPIISSKKVFLVKASIFGPTQLIF